MEIDLLFPQNAEYTKSFIEDPDKFEHMLSLFENWLHYQKHLPQAHGKTVLSNFLRLCKMDLEKAKRKFERFCYLSQTHPPFFANRGATLEHDTQYLDFVYLLFLPRLTADGSRIFVLKHFNVDKVEMDSLYRYSTSILDYRMHNDISESEIGIFDLELIGPQYYSKLFSASFMKLMKVLLEGYPARIKSIYIITRHSAFEKGANFCKIFLPDKIKNRVYFLKDPTDLCKYIPKKYLPSDYNGEEDSLANINKRWKNLALENKEFFKSLDEMTPIGPLPKHITKYDDELGIDGSFRKLNID